MHQYATSSSRSNGETNNNLGLTFSSNFSRHFEPTSRLTHSRTYDQTPSFSRTYFGGLSTKKLIPSDNTGLNNRVYQSGFTHDLDNSTAQSKSNGRISALASKYLLQDAVDKRKNGTTYIIRPKPTFLGSLQDNLDFQRHSESPYRGAGYTSPSLTLPQRSRSRQGSPYACSSRIVSVFTIPRKPYQDQLSDEYERIKLRYNSMLNGQGAKLQQTHYGRTESNLPDQISNENTETRMSRKSSWAKHYTNLSSKWAENTGSTVSTSKYQYSYTPHVSADKDASRSSSASFKTGNLTITNSRLGSAKPSASRNWEHDDDNESIEGCSNRSEKFANNGHRSRKRSFSRRRGSEQEQSVSRWNKKLNSSTKSSSDEEANPSNSAKDRIRARKKRLQKSKALLMEHKEDNWNYRLTLHANKTIDRLTQREMQVEKKPMDNIESEAVSEFEEKSTKISAQSETPSVLHNIEHVHATCIEPPNLQVQLNPSVKSRLNVPEGETHVSDILCKETLKAYIEFPLPNNIPADRQSKSPPSESPSNSVNICFKLAPDRKLKIVPNLSSTESLHSASLSLVLEKNGNVKVSDENCFFEKSIANQFQQHYNCHISLALVTDERVCHLVKITPTLRTYMPVAKPRHSVKNLAKILNTVDTKGHASNAKQAPSDYAENLNTSDSPRSKMSVVMVQRLQTNKETSKTTDSATKKLLLCKSQSEITKYIPKSRLNSENKPTGSKYDISGVTITQQPIGLDNNVTIKKQAQRKFAQPVLKEKTVQSKQSSSNETNRHEKAVTTATKNLKLHNKLKLNSIDHVIVVKNVKNESGVDADLAECTSRRIKKNSVAMGDNKSQNVTNDNALDDANVIQKFNEATLKTCRSKRVTENFANLNYYWISNKDNVAPLKNEQELPVQEIVKQCADYPVKYEIITEAEPQLTTMTSNVHSTSIPDRKQSMNTENQYSSARHLKAKLQAASGNDVIRSHSMDKRGEARKVVTRAMSTDSHNNGVSRPNLEIHKLPSVNKEMLKLLTLGGELSRAEQISGISSESLVQKSHTCLKKTELRSSFKKLTDRKDSSDSLASFSTASSQPQEFKNELETVTKAEPFQVSSTTTESSYRKAVRSLKEKSTNGISILYEPVSTVLANRGNISRPGHSLDQASIKIDQMLQIAKQKHENERHLLRKVTNDLDKMYEQMTEDLSKSVNPVSNCSTRYLQPQETLKQNEPQSQMKLQLQFEKAKSCSYMDNHLSDSQIPYSYRNKMDYTKLWLKGELKLLANNAKPDLLQFDSSVGVDGDQCSIGSASAEVAAITNRERLHALRVPDFVPNHTKVIKPAPIHVHSLASSPNSFLSRNANKLLSSKLYRSDMIYNEVPEPKHKPILTEHVNRNQLQYQKPDYILAIATKEFGAVKRQVDAIDKFSDNESERSVDKNQYKALMINNGNSKRIYASSRISQFIRKFESDESLIQHNAIQSSMEQLEAQQVKLEKCVRGIKNACKMQATTISLSRNGSTHSLPVSRTQTFLNDKQKSRTFDKLKVNENFHKTSCYVPSDSECQEPYDEVIKKVDNILNEISITDPPTNHHSLLNYRFPSEIRKISPARQSLNVIPEHAEHYENISFTKNGLNESFDNGRVNGIDGDTLYTLQPPNLPPRNKIQPEPTSSYSSKRTSWHEPAYPSRFLCEPPNEDAVIYEAIPVKSAQKSDDAISENVERLQYAPTRPPLSTESTGTLSILSKPLKNLFQMLSRSTNKHENQKLNFGTTDQRSIISKEAPRALLNSEAVVLTSAVGDKPKMIHKSHSENYASRIKGYSTDNLEDNIAPNDNDPKQRRFRLSNWGCRKR